MTIQEITDRNYAATTKRALINKFTTVNDFVNKLDEEVSELDESILDNSFHESELADIALVCFAMAKHYNINLVEAMEEKMLYNEQRID